MGKACAPRVGGVALPSVSILEVIANFENLLSLDLLDQSAVAQESSDLFVLDHHNPKPCVL